MRSIAAVALTCLALARPLALPQTPRFSSRVEAVRVDVLVTDRGGLVRGLRAGDFEVLDNGVPQQVDLVTFEHLPLNIVLALDMSDSVAGDRLDHLRAAGLAVVDQLAPVDEAALVTFSHEVALRSPLTANRDRVRAALQLSAARGQTALVDATHTGIVLAESGVGRSLLILFSDGFDTASWLSEDTVLDTASRTDVVAYCVSTRESQQASFTEDLAELTGGSRIELESTRDLSGAFVRILDEFRQRYLLSFTPRGVSKDGWHRLEVRVKGRRLTIRARRGYLAGN
jgi:VWFA-related protein